MIIITEELQVNFTEESISSEGRTKTVKIGSPESRTWRYSIGVDPSSPIKIGDPVTVTFKFKEE